MLMQKLRNKHFMKGAMWIIVIGVIPSFVAFYGFSANQGGGAHPDEALVTVTLPGAEKREFNRNELVRTQNELAGYYVNLYSLLTGQRANPEFARSIAERISNDDVAEHAAVRVAMEKRAEDLDIVVGPKQVEQLLIQEGVTAQQLQQVLTARGISQHQFLMEQRSELQHQRGLDSVQRVARASLLEMWQDYRRVKEELTAEVLTVPAAPLREGIEPTDADLATELELLKKESPNSVRQPAERVYAYVRVDGPEEPVPAQPTDDELLAALDAAPATDASLTAGDGARLRHVLIGVDTKTTDTARLDAARERAASARQRILGGEDFATVANEVSDDWRNVQFESPETSPTLRGGIIPRLLDGTPMDEAIWGGSLASFAAKGSQGDVSDVIETPQGYSVAKVEVRGKGLKRSLEEVRDLLSTRIVDERLKAADQKRKDDIQALVERVRAVSGTQSTLEGMARELGVEVGTTPKVAVSSRFITGVGDLQRDGSILEDLRKNEISPVMTTSAGDVVVLKVLEDNPERFRTVEEARAMLTDSFRNRKALELAKARAEELRAELKAEDNLTSFGLERSLQVAKFSTPFTRAELPMELNGIQNVANATLGASAGTTLVARRTGTPEQDGYALVRITSVKEPDRKTFIGELQQFEMTILGAKRQGTLEDFFEDARRSATITSSEFFVRSKANASGPKG